MESLARKELEAVLYELAVFRVNRTLSDLSAVVPLVIEERMSYPIEMYTYLVGSSGLKATFHHSHISETFKNAIVCYGMLAMIALREDLKAHAVIRVSSDVTGNCTLVLF